MKTANSFKETSCEACPIRFKAVCSKCEPDEFETLDSIKYYKSYAAGEPIAYAGDDAGFVASVVDGVATLTQTMPDGRVQMVGLLLPGDFIGRPNRHRIAYDVEATSDVTLCCFRREPFARMVEETPHINQRLLEMTLDELDAAREWMLLLGRKTAREKIASLFCLIARRIASLEKAPLEQDIEFDLPISREAMGNFLGLTIETVSRQVSNLKKDGLIALDGSRKVIITDLAALQAETGDDTDGGFLS